MRILIVILLGFIALSVATRHIEVEKAGSTHHINQWTRATEKILEEDHISIGFAIKQRNLRELDSIFWSVSNPHSSNYGKYLSKEQLAELVGAEDSTINKVTHWLKANHAKSVKVSATRDYIWASLKPYRVEELLRISLNEYVYHDVRVNKRARITRSEDTPSVPLEIASHIDFVSGVWNFPAVDSVFKRHASVDRLVEIAKEKPTPDEVVPSILTVQGIPNALLILFQPICSDGNTSELIVNPCLDYGNPITSYTVNTTQWDYNQNQEITQTQTFTNTSANWASCTIEVSLFGDFLYCTLNVSNLVNDVNVTASFMYCFADGSCTTSVGVSGNDGNLFQVPSSFHNPNDIRSHYGIPPSAIGTNGTNKQAVVEFIMQFFSPADLTQFLSEFDLPSAKVEVVGPNDPPFPGEEASLDIQYLMGVAQGIETWFWSMDGSDWVAEWAQAVLNTPNAPWVHSISYGAPEASSPLPYINRTEVELQKLGAAGMSVLISSGDSGTGANCSLYGVSWPSSSPHVTAVGATRITRGATLDCLSSPQNADCATIGEVSASYDLGLFWTTGGGFSNVFSTPSYQQAAVNAYLNQTAILPPASFFNKNGRGYPDVSAVGHYLLVVDGGVVSPIDGTSAATPIFAGVVSLLNEARIQAGKPTLGFLNSWLYSLAGTEAFYDVTVGDTTYCGGIQDACCETSFVAAQGWDAASGLGTPNFPALLKQAMSLP